MPVVLGFRAGPAEASFGSSRGFAAFRTRLRSLIVNLMPGIARLIGFGILFVCFCYYFQQGEQWKALSLQLAVLWLVFREARILLNERSNLPPRRRK